MSSWRNGLCTWAAGKGRGDREGPLASGLAQQMAEERTRPGSACVIIKRSETRGAGNRTDCSWRHRMIVVEVWPRRQYVTAVHWSASAVPFNSSSLTPLAERRVCTAHSKVNTRLPIQRPRTITIMPASPAPLPPLSPNHTRTSPTFPSRARCTGPFASAPDSECEEPRTPLV